MTTQRGAPLGRDPGYPSAEKIRLYATVGAAIRAKRKEAGLSIRKCAEAIGVSTSTLDNYESGTTPPTLLALHRLTMTLDCSADDLMPVVVDGAAA